MCTCAAPFAFLHQSGNSLCAFYAIRHFRGDLYSQEAFLSQAAHYYASSIPDVSLDFAKQLAVEGNSEALVQSLLGGKAQVKKLTNTDLAFYNRILIADIQDGHFLTIRKCTCKSSWWNYNSTQAKPSQLANVREFVDRYTDGVNVFYVSL